jgi:pimeloyl-ACP methyl ester carboxylesterase
VLVSAPASDLAAAFAGDAPSDHDVFLKGVALRPGVTADLHLRVLGDPRPGCAREAILAVHGASVTAACFVPFAKALLARGGDRATRARWFAAIDLPAHGQSPPPTGALFGELSLDDYVAAVVGTLDRLREQGIRVTTLVGLSMGGATVLLVQQALLRRGTSLREAYGVERTVGLAPACWPGDIPCAIAQDPQMAAALGQFQALDPTLGPVLQLPPAALQRLAWSKPDGALGAGAPTPEEIVAGGWAAPEAGAALGMLLGGPGIPRATFERGIFDPARGTQLQIVSYQHDTLVRPEENEALYQYATGQSPEHGWTRVDGDGAVHAMVLSDTAGMLAAIEGRVSFL